MLKIDNLSYRYPSRKQFTLKNINLTLADGEMLLLAGRSGCGKSTLIKAVSGLLGSEERGELQGAIYLQGEDISKWPPEKTGQLVGTVTNVTFKGMQYDIIVDFRGFKWLIQTTDHSPVGARIGVKIDPEGFHIMKKSEYSGMFGDYSSYSEEYEELADASAKLEEEESEDEE